MPNDYTAFWCALLDYARTQDRGARLWNGYIGWKLPPGMRTETPRSRWPHDFVPPPPDGWPELTESERSELDVLARQHGGHPGWNSLPLMDFSGRRFASHVILSELTLIGASFSKVRFHDEVRLERSRFFTWASFEEATFEASADFQEAYFESRVSFDRVQFSGRADFASVEFNGGAAFDGAVFQRHVDFNDSKFVETS